MAVLALPPLWWAYHLMRRTDLQRQGLITTIWLITATVWAGLLIAQANLVLDSVGAFAVAYFAYIASELRPETPPTREPSRREPITDLITVLYEFDPSWNQNWRPAIVSGSWDATKKRDLIAYAHRLTSSLARAQSEGRRPAISDGQIQEVLRKMNHLCDMVPESLLSNPYARPGYDFDQFTILGDEIVAIINTRVIPQLRADFPG